MKKFTLTPLLFLQDRASFILSSSEFIIIDKNTEEEIKYKIEYRSGGVPNKILVNNEPKTYNIVAQINSLYFKENINTPSIENFSGYIVNPSTARLSYNMSKGDTSIWTNSYCSPYCTEIEIPEDVVTLSQDSIIRCDNLQKVILPSSLKIIEKYNFNYCENLSEIICYAKEAPIITDTYYTCNDLKPQGTLYVPKGCIGNYSEWINNLNRWNDNWEIKEI
jgi:hypothetical protein